MSLEGIELVEKISEIIVDKKGINPVILEVGEFSSVTNYLLIAEGLVERHVTAIARTIAKEIRETMQVRPNHVEGMHVGDWILMDYVVANVHLFKPGMREKYNLESLWSQGKNLNSRKIS